MNQETFQIFLWVMSAVALFVFIALYFVKAGYGMFRTASWGISINNKLAWMLMEAPVFMVMFALWWMIRASICRAGIFHFLPLFQLHYFQRAFIFPFLLKGKSRMPLAIMSMGIVFNLLNGMMQANGLFYLAPETCMPMPGWFTSPSGFLLGAHSVFRRYARSTCIRIMSYVICANREIRSIIFPKRNVPLCHFRQLFR